MSNNLGKLKVESFRLLNPGWFYGSGITPTEKTIQNSLILLEVIINSGFNKTDAFPGENGEIQVSGYSDDEYIEIIINFDNINLFSYEKNDKEVYYKEDISISNALTLINHRRGMAWVLSGLSTGSSLILQRNDLQVLSSNPHQMEPAYQFSTEHAQLELVKQYAVISSGITEDLMTKHLPAIGIFQRIESSPNMSWTQFQAQQAITAT